MRDAMLERLGELRYEPTPKRVRAVFGGQTAVDSTRSVLVWEPRRVVPSYAVPVEDVRGELEAAAASDHGDAAEQPILHPGIPFAVHSTPGQSFDLRADGERRAAAVFRPAAPELAGHVVLDYYAFDDWYEEDEPIVGHPRDPYHRVDFRRSARSVRVELEGQVVAESSRATPCFETNLPLRFYLPREDAPLDLLASDKRTTCAYKGEASYWSLDLDGRRHADLLWSYEDPLPDARAITGLVAFWDEKVDIVLDGERRERRPTAMSEAILDEAGA
jgi:uncharacterized protein (DUF427 family)